MTVLVFFLLVFLAVSTFFLFFHLMLGTLVRPIKPDPDKLTIYECGEPTVGSAWIQFDLRYYVVALLFVIFDVEVAFFFPWALVYGKANTLAREELVVSAEVQAKESDPKKRQELERAKLTAELLPPDKELPRTPGTETESVPHGVAAQFAVIAMLDLLIFFGVLLVGFAYLWKRGDIDWVRSVTAERVAGEVAPSAAPPLPAAEQQRPLVGAGS
jgi:NADH-quinone oxidoreductase subunit A